MKIKRAFASNITIPFKENSRYNLNSRGCTSSFIICLEAEDEIIGFGEGIPRPFISNESCERILRIFNTQLKPIIQGKEFSSKTEVNQYLSGLKQLDKFPSLLCALELALIDIVDKNQSAKIGKLLFNSKIGFNNLTHFSPYSLENRPF